MNKNKKELITFSEAARIRNVKPQTIGDLVKRGRLKVEEVSGKKFLNREDVEKLEKGKSGRPSKNGKYNLKMLDSAIGKFFKPEKYYTNVFSILLMARRSYRQESSSSEDKKLGFENLLWRKNRIKLRESLKGYERKWMPDACCDEIVVSKKYVGPIIQEFYVYCLTSEEMYKEDFSFLKLKHNFISYCESKLNFKPSSSHNALITDLFKEGKEEGLSERENLYRLLNLILENTPKIRKIEESTKILRYLYEHNLTSTKSLNKVLKVKRENRRKMSKT